MCLTCICVDSESDSISEAPYLEKMKKHFYSNLLILNEVVGGKEIQQILNFCRDKQIFQCL